MGRGDHQESQKLYLALAGLEMPSCWCPWSDLASLQLHQKDCYLAQILQSNHAQLKALRIPAISHHHWLKWLSMGLMPSNMMPFCDRLHTSPHMQQCFKRLCAILEAAVHNQFTARIFVISVMMAFASF